MSGERKRQTEFSGQTRTEIAGAKKINGNVGIFARISVHSLRRLWFFKIAAQLVQQLREILARRYLRTTQRTRCCRVAARRAADTQVYAAGKQRFECAELLGNGQRGMIRQHDTARADANPRCSIGNVANQNGSRRTRDPSNIVMFSQPEAFVIERFRPLSQ